MDISTKESSKKTKRPESNQLAPLNRDEINKGRKFIWIDYPTIKAVSVADEGERLIGIGNDPLNINIENVEKNTKRIKGVKTVETFHETYVFIPKIDMSMEYQKKDWILFSFNIVSILISGILPSAQVSYNSELQPGIQYITGDGFAKIFATILNFNLLGGDYKYNTFHPLYVPSLQITIKYRSNNYIYAETEIMDKATLHELQDQLYPDFPAYRKGEINKISDPLKKIPAENFADIEAYLASLFTEILSKIRNKKKSYSLDTVFEDIVLDLIGMYISVGNK